MMDKAALKIGEVAARSGVGIDTLRYYERLGLLPRAARTRSGYRVYDPKMIDRIAFIKRAKSFGFTLDEICDLVRLETADPDACSRVLRVIEQKFNDLNRRYGEIKRLRRELAAYKATCERAIANNKSCPVIEDFLHGFYKRTNTNGGNTL
jgi:MerR family mercuric resistance operon transcriptional regulator